MQIWNTFPARMYMCIQISSVCIPTFLFCITNRVIGICITCIKSVILIWLQRSVDVRLVATKTTVIYEFPFNPPPPLNHPVCSSYSLFHSRPLAFSHSLLQFDDSHLVRCGLCEDRNGCAVPVLQNNGLRFQEGPPNANHTHTHATYSHRHPQHTTFEINFYSN